MFKGNARYFELLALKDKRGIGDLFIVLGGGCLDGLE
jgi:hypothetical protein